MKFGFRIKCMKSQSLCILLFASTIFCVAPLVNAADVDCLANRSGQNLNDYEQICKSALNGSAESQHELGLRFEYGRGVEQDDVSAVYWYEKSADQGYSSAQYRLAVLIDNGWGHPIDKEKAFDLYKSAALKGHELAQHDLAFMYFEGSGIDKDLVQAYKWLKIAVLSGNPLMQKHLRKVRQEMTSHEIKVAEIYASKWQGYPGI